MDGMDVRERARRLDELKRKKAEHSREKEAIMRALAEDKAEREQKAEQKKLAMEAEASSTGGLRSAPGGHECADSPALRDRQHMC